MAVGPERFGVVAIDCAKARSKWMLADFYGTVLLPPAVVEHRRSDLAVAVSQLCQARDEHRLQEVIVCVEMTGAYHKPVQRAFRQAGFETRLAHPFASNHYRLAQHGDIKTNDHDLAGIFRTAVNGFGLIESPGELGPIERYASASVIRGRAGLFPSRHQSDQVDRGGNLSRFRNARLRRAFVLAADNMLKCNTYWREKARDGQSRGVDPRDIRCRIAGKLAGTVFQMMMGRRLYRHPSRLDRGYVMDKLLTYHREHHTPPHVIVGDLERVVLESMTLCRGVQRRIRQLGALSLFYTRLARSNSAGAARSNRRRRQNGQSRAARHHRCDPLNRNGKKPPPGPATGTR